MNSEEYKSLKENADILKENALAKCNLEVNKQETIMKAISRLFGI